MNAIGRIGQYPGHRAKALVALDLIHACFIISE